MIKTIKGDISPEINFIQREKSLFYKYVLREFFYFNSFNKTMLYRPLDSWAVEEEFK